MKCSGSKTEGGEVFVSNNETFKHIVIHIYSISLYVYLWLVTVLFALLAADWTRPSTKYIQLL